MPVSIFAYSIFDHLDNRLVYPALSLIVFGRRRYVRYHFKP